MVLCNLRILCGKNALYSSSVHSFGLFAREGWYRLMKPDALRSLIYLLRRNFNDFFFRRFRFLSPLFLLPHGSSQRRCLCLIYQRRRSSLFCLSVCLLKEDRSRHEERAVLFDDFSCTVLVGKFNGSSFKKGVISVPTPSLVPSAISNSVPPSLDQ